MNFDAMTDADLAAYDRFCADLAEHGFEGSTHNFIPSMVEAPF